MLCPNNTHTLRHTHKISGGQMALGRKKLSLVIVDPR